MLISRGATLLRTVCNNNNVKNFIINRNPTRSMSHSWVYRTVNTPTKQSIILAEVVGAVGWWWILWHFWHDYEELIGEWPHPDPSLWTDEELGIPPDDED